MPCLPSQPPSRATQPHRLEACTTDSLYERSGPGVEYSTVGGLPREECVTLDARSTDGAWARVFETTWWNAVPGGWLYAGYLQVSGDLAALPVGYVEVVSVPTRRAPTAIPQRIVAAPTNRPITSAGVGATAICYDGWVSHSQHRRGTCSHHGGVRQWLRDDIPP